MSPTPTITEPRPADVDDAIVAEHADADATGDGLLIDELLIEEISIDGMCGVY